MATTIAQLILLAGAVLAVGCGPKVVSEPPPQSVGSVSTSSDAGLPAVPLNRRGVIVPSDVKLEPPPKEVLAPTGSPTAPVRPSGS